MGIVHCCAGREKSTEDKMRGQMIIKYMQNIERKQSVIVVQRPYDEYDNQEKYFN